MAPALAAARGTVERVTAASRADGLAAGLRAVLATGVPVPCSPGGRTLVPTGADVGPARVLPHPLAACEGLDLVEPTRPETGGGGSDPVDPADTGNHAAALLLGAVRLGLTAAMLDLALRHLGGRAVEGAPLTGKQLVRGALAEAHTALELARCELLTADTAAAVEALHTRLDAAGWLVTRLFGGSGYLRDHPVRCLYVAALVADAWVTPIRAASEVER